MTAKFRWHWAMFLMLAATPLMAQGGGTAGSSVEVGGSGPASAVPGVPPMPLVTGSLELSVVYPKWKDLVDARDTSFIFGSTGDGTATLTVNGYPVPVWPNGAWFAWIPFPQDRLMEFHLVARTQAESAELTYLAQRASRFVPPRAPVWIDTTAIQPRGRMWWPAGEEIPLSLRAAPGATVRIILQDGTVIPLVADPAPAAVPWGIRAFGREPLARLHQPLDETRYVGVLLPRTLGSSPGPIVGGPPGVDPPPPAAIIEAIRGADTARVGWPIELAVIEGPPVVVELDDDPNDAGDTDGITIGRAAPGATFHWFFPRGTRAAVSGRINGSLRLQLSRYVSAWIPEDEARLMPLGTPRPSARVGFLTMTPEADRVRVRIPVDRRVPFRVDEGDASISVRLYSAHGDPNWIRYGGTDPLVHRVDWLQDRSDEVVLDFRLSQPVWGYRTWWDGNDLMLDIRRPPVIDPEQPLRDRLIVVDPGHPPAGAKGPTGLREAEANLAVALRVRTLLERAGAKVVMTRVSDSSVGLRPRVQLADSIDAELLVSIHNNALPDGVNPFVAHGSSVFYFHPQSLPLARAIQGALVKRLQLRNLGVSRGNLALTRPTWMPAVLTEGLFIMMPEQEAVLRTAEGQQLYALAVVEGIEAFLAQR
ncbi:MAG: N-acetylmuramoyl-L-alanine amidase [Gemmatimonadetes bacterium]|nr:N-acetylmuramoyl-L-alanine amidase [Gemmatimonadota bacterium]